MPDISSDLSAADFTGDLSRDMVNQALHPNGQAAKYQASFKIQSPIEPALRKIGDTLINAGAACIYTCTLPAPGAKADSVVFSKDLASALGKLIKENKANLTPEQLALLKRTKAAFESLHKFTKDNNALNFLAKHAAQLNLIRQELQEKARNPEYSTEQKAHFQNMAKVISVPAPAAIAPQTPLVPSQPAGPGAPQPQPAGAPPHAPPPPAPPPPPRT